MPAEKFDVWLYEVYLTRDAAREGMSHVPAAKIHCCGRQGWDDQLLDITFWRDMNDAPDNESDLAAGRVRGYIHVPAEQYPWYIDLLRNEKPIQVRVYTEPALNSLTTSSERPGEGET